MIHVLGLLLVSVAWLLPGHYFPWPAFYQEAICAAGAALVVLSHLLRAEPGPAKAPGISLLALSLALVPPMQWAFGLLHFVADALLPMMYLAAFGILIVSSRSLAMDPQSRFTEGLVAACLIGSLVSGVIALGQGLQLGWISYVEQVPPGGRAFANLTQPNHLASVLGLGLVSTWWLYERRWIHAPACVAVILLLGTALAMTQSRMALVFIVGALALWALTGRRLPTRAGSPGVLAICVLLLCLFPIWQWLSSLIEGAAAYGISDRLQIEGGRRIHWPAMWDAIWRQPIWGWGWLQGTAAQQAVVFDHPASQEWITYSHNVGLDILLWNGVPIGAFVLLCLGAWTVARIRRCDDPDGFVALIACSVIAVHALFEFPHAYAYFLFPLAMWIGVVEARLGTESLMRPLQMRKPAVAGISLALVALLTLLWKEYQQVEEMSQRTRFSEARYVVPPGMEPAVPEVLLIDTQREFLRFRQMSARPGMSAEELDVIRKVSQRFMPPAVLLRRALAMGLNGYEADARHALGLICQVWTKKNCEEGRESWEKAQALYPQISHIRFPDAGP